MASRRVTIEFLGDDKSLSKTARSVDGTTRRLGDTFKQVGKTAAIGLGVGIAAAGTALVAFGKGAAAEAKEARKVTAQTEAVIKSTGGAANVTAGQVGKLAEALSMKAGIDDEVIQSGANMLLTFKNIRNEAGKGNDVFDQTTQIALDMSVAMGQDMKSSAILVGKALNDPIKGLSALSRVGVTFTEKQKKVIERLVESGDTMKAQKIILKELNSEFGGSAAAQADAGDKAAVAWGNFQEMVGAKLLPLLDRLAVFFVTVIVPALQRFAAWFEREGIPAIKRFAEQAGKWIGRFVDFVREHWPEISRVIRDVLRNVFGIVRGIVDLIRAYWDKWGEDILRIAKIVFGFIIATIRNAMKVIRGVIDVVTGLIKGDWSQVWKGIRQIFGGIWDQIKTVLRTALKFVRESIRNAWDAVKDITKRVWGALLDLLRAALGKIRDAIAWYLGKYRDIIRGAWEKVRDVVANAWNWIRDRIADVLSAIRDRISNIVDAIRDRVADVFGAMRDRISDIWGSVRDRIGRVWDGIKNIFGRLKDGVRAIPDAFKAAKEQIGRIWDGLKRIAAAPINFVINKVYMGGIRKVVNALPDPIPDLPEVNPIKFRRGGYTGHGPKDRVAGLVHAREFVINAEAVDRIERTNPGFLERLNRSGFPGHRGGGLVNPMKRVYVDGEPLTAVHAAQLLIAGQLMGVGQHVMQGSWQPATSYSGTSHTGPGVADTSPGSFRAQWAHRRAGLASWARNIPGAAYAGSGAHLHGISPFSAPGNSQLAAYFAGGDGLGGSDYGPRPPVMPGLRDRLRRFGDLTTVGGALGLGLDFGRFPAAFGSIAGGAMGALDAVPDFLNGLDDIWDDINSMASRGGWWPLISKVPGAFMDDLKDWGLDKIKDAGGWMRDESAGLIGEMGIRAHDAWQTIDDIDFPGLADGGVVKARRGGTLVRVGEGGRDEVVRPVADDQLVAELHVYLDGKQIQQSLVRLKRRNGGAPLGLN